MNSRIFNVLALSVALMPGALFAELRVPTGDAMRAALNKEQPTYPPMAKQMKIAGRVEVELNIDAQGAVESAKVVSGNALLSGAAMSAAKRWKFSPFVENGAPAKAVTVINFDFKL